MAFRTLPRVTAAATLAGGLLFAGTGAAWASGGGSSPPATDTTGDSSTGTTPTATAPAGGDAAGGGDSCDAACMQQVRAALQAAQQALQLVNTALASTGATAATPPPTPGTGTGTSTGTGTRTGPTADVPPPTTKTPGTGTTGTTNGGNSGGGTTPTQPVATAPTDPTATPGGGGTGAPAGSDLQQELALINTDRAAHGCQPVTADPAAAKVATDYAAAMLTGKFFSHTTPTGQTAAQRATTAGATGAWGENIAEGQPSPTAVMAAWQASPGHQANIVNCAFTTVGLGQAPGAGGPVWVQMFSDKTTQPTPGGTPSTTAPGGTPSGGGAVG